jgi:hypothetical protein
MSIPKYKANDRALMSEDEVWGLPRQIEILFADKVKLVTTCRRTIISWYMWRLHRDFPGCPVLSTHHIGNKRFVKRSELKRLSVIFWDVYEGHLEKHENTVWEMSKATYEIINTIHNITVSRLSPYVTTTDLADIAEIMTHPVIAGAKRKAQERIDANEDGSVVLAETFNEIFSTLDGDDPSLRRNGIAKMVRCGLLNRNQILQFIGPRGFVKSTDGTMYSEPIYAGYADGLKNLYDSMTESRTASLALYMNEGPLQDSEYFNRQMQLLAAVISGVGQDDCGTQHTLEWYVNENDLEGLEGKYHIVDGKPVLFSKRDSHYVGKIINLRSITRCANPDPTVVCKTCLGLVHRVIPPRTNVGHFLTIEPLATLSQLILSTKHVVASVASLYLDLSGLPGKWFRYDSQNKSAIRVKKANIANSYCIRFLASEASGLNSIASCSDVSSLPPQRISCITGIQIANADVDGSPKGEWDSFDTVVGGVGSALSGDVIEAIQRNGFKVVGEMIEVLLDDFRDKVIIITPRRNEDMMTYLKQVKHFVFGAENKNDKGDSLVSYTNPALAVASLKRIFDEKITVNVIHAEILVRACMTRINPNDRYGNTDYNLPVGGEAFRFTNAKAIIHNRSISAALAFQGQKNLLTNPQTFLVRDRHPHPLDAFIY